MRRKNSAHFLLFRGKTFVPNEMKNNNTCATAMCIWLLPTHKVIVVVTNEEGVFTQNIVLVYIVDLRPE